MPKNLGGRPPRNPDFPLRMWLRGIGVKPYKFAVKLRDLQGRKISHQRLYQYMSGQRAIPADLATRIDYLTRGAVPIRCWQLVLDDKGQYYSLGHKIGRREATQVRSSHNI